MPKKGKKRFKRKEASVHPTPAESVDYFSTLSDELVCQILSFLPLREVFCMSLQNRKFYNAVQLHLHLRKVIDFTEGKIHCYMPAKINDDVLIKILQSCQKLETIYGLHPWLIEKRRQRIRKCLSIPGILEALSNCENLKGVEVSDLKLLETILENLPQVDIICHFRNRDGQFPIPPNYLLRLPPSPKITCLHLTGVEITELPSMLQLEFLYLQWVRFLHLRPFQHFSAPKLQVFAMKHCAGPLNAGPFNAIDFVPLVLGLAKAVNLKHVEFIRVPFLAGWLRRTVEENWQNNAFHHLATIITGACRNLLETDIGFMMLTSINTLTTLKLQPSLSKDIMLLPLVHCQAQFHHLKRLHIGFVDEFPPKGSWSNEELMVEGLADVVEMPSPMTDAGMKIVTQVFPTLEVLAINWCPHIFQPSTWNLADGSGWRYLRNLIIKRCYCLKLEDFETFLSSLTVIECVVLEDMFIAPSRGCSHVGLSAGTGLGMSSAIVNNQQNPIEIAHNGGIEGVINPRNDDQHVENIEFAEGIDNIQNGNENGPSHDFAEENEDHICKENSIDQTECDCACESSADVCNKESLEKEKNVQQASSPNKCTLQQNNSNSNDEDSNCTCSCHKYASGSLKREERISEFDKPGTSGLRTSFNRAGKSKKQQVDQACQVTNEDIRLSTRNNGGSSRQQPSSVPSELKNRTRPKTTSQKNKDKRPKTVKKNGCDKATSTSDPMFNDEPKRMITLVSDSLITITFIACGLTHIEINYCPKLQHLEINACALFKNINLKSATTLINVNVSECPQVEAAELIKEVAQLPARRDRFVYIKLPKKESIRDVEQMLIESNNLNYHFCFLQDYCAADDKRIQNRQCLRSWMKLWHDINLELLKKWNFSQMKKSKTITSKLGINNYWQNVNCREGDYIAFTDIPWLRELWLPAQIGNAFSEIYDPNSLGYSDSEDCLKKMVHFVAEAKEQAVNLHLFTLGIYFHHGLTSQMNKDMQLNNKL